MDEQRCTPRALPHGQQPLRLNILTPVSTLCASTAIAMMVLTTLMKFEHIQATSASSAGHIIHMHIICEHIRVAKSTKRKLQQGME
eukprot:1134558-Pelagomonas_calceolata.AAC.4